MTPDISSAQNPRVKAAVKLRDRRDRGSQGRFLIDGLREIERAIAAGIEIEEAFIKTLDHHPPALAAIAGSLHAAGVTTYLTAPLAFEKLCFGDRDEGIVAVAKLPSPKLADFELPSSALVIVLENVEKPGNLGAVLRTADAAAASAVIVAGSGTDLFNPNVVRASLGAIFTVPVFAAPPSDVLAWLESQQLTIFAARVDGAVEYTQADYVPPCAIVLGSESQGLSDVWKTSQVTPIALPMLGVVDSLNVSTTAAIIAYEAVRQRRASHRR